MRDSVANHRQIQQATGSAATDSSGKHGEKIANHGDLDTTPKIATIRHRFGSATYRSSLAGPGEEGHRHASLSDRKSSVTFAAPGRVENGNAVPSVQQGKEALQHAGNDLTRLGHQPTETAKRVLPVRGRRY